MGGGYLGGNRGADQGHAQGGLPEAPQSAPESRRRADAGSGGVALWGCARNARKRLLRGLGRETGTPPPLPAGPLPPEGVAEGGGRGVRLAHGLGRAFEAMPDRAEGARAVLRLVEILRESWMDFANRQQIRAPSGFSRSGRVELPWGLGGVKQGVTHTRTRSRCPSARRFPAQWLRYRSALLSRSGNASQSA